MASEDRRALYLRWRPTRFSDVVGQEHVVRTLRNAVKAGTAAHAYLFAGPRGTGKTSVARILFRALNCLQPRDGDPCGTCAICQSALAGRSLDLVEIDAASNRGIDDVRELREKVAFAPSEVRYRVYIVDEAHELTAPAWDAFLKTLEEPPPHAVFVMATTEAHRVPGTIVSRCQRFDFRRIRTVDISARLEQIAAEEGLDLAPAAAERLARLARGGLRDAISLLDQAASFTVGRVDLEALREALGLSDLQAAQDLLAALTADDPASALRRLAELADTGADPRLLAEDLQALLRGLLFVRAGAGAALGGDFSAEELAWLEAQAEAWSADGLRLLLKTISDSLIRTRDAGQFRLQLELALLGAIDRPIENPASRPLASPDQRVSGAPAGSTAAGSEVPPAASGSPAEPAAAEQPILGPETRPASQPTVSAERPPTSQPSPSPVPPPARPASGSGSVSSGPAATAEIGLEASPSAAPEAGPLTLDLAREHWPRVIEWVGRRNSFVASYLRPAELRSLGEGWLVLSFGFKVHHERVAETRNRSLVEQACQAVLGCELRLKCEYESPSADSTALDLDDPVLRFALERFGGRPEIVD